RPSSHGRSSISSSSYPSSRDVTARARRPWRSRRARTGSSSRARRPHPVTAMPGWYVLAGRQGGLPLGQGPGGRLAGRRALDLRDPDDPLGQLVPREALAQEGPQLVVGGLLLAVAVLDHRGDHLAVPLVRGAGDHRVEHGGVRFGRLLHLFREDLSAGAVAGA